MTFGERITQLRKEKGYSSRNELADLLGIPSTTLRNYETDAREPGHSFLIRISELYEVSVDYLLGITDERERTSPYALRSSEISHMKKYRSLDLYGKETVDYVLDRETERTQQLINAKSFSSPTSTRIIQYYQRLASAGTGEVVFEDVPVDRITIPDIPKYKRVSYAIGVNGSSMEPRYHDGDILLIEPTCQIDIGEIGIFIVGDKAYVKKLGSGELISLNKKHGNIALTEDSKCMGRVIDIYNL